MTSRRPRANAVADRWVRSARSECLEHLIVFGAANLRRVLSAYVAYCNRWRPHRSLGQATPCGEAISLRQHACRKIAVASLLGGLHHIYPRAPSGKAPTTRGSALCRLDPSQHVVLYVPGRALQKVTGGHRSRVNVSGLSVGALLRPAPQKR